MRGRRKLSDIWISLVVVTGLVAVAGSARATPIHRVSHSSHGATLASLTLAGVSRHSFLGAGPLSGDVVQLHVPNGRAIGWYRHHRGEALPNPVSDPADTTADTTVDTTGDSTADSTGDTTPGTQPAIPENSAALLFGAGSLLVASTLRRRKATA